MSLVGFIVLLVLGALCGALAQGLVGYSVGGFLASAALGIVGSFVGSWLAAALHLPALLVVRFEGVSIDFVWAVAGAALLLGIVMMIRRGSARTRRGYV